MATKDTDGQSIKDRLAAARKRKEAQHEQEGHAPDLANEAEIVEKDDSQDDNSQDIHIEDENSQHIQPKDDTTSEDEMAQTPEQDLLPSTETDQTDGVTEQEESQNEAVENTALTESAKTEVTKPGKAPFGQYSVNEATSYIREAQNNLEKIAQSIAMGEYTETGAGDAGRIYRACQETPESGMESVWGEILALCAGLWEKGYEAEAVLFIEQSNAAFPVPETWKEQVEGALRAAADYKTARDAEVAFEEGDDKTAQTLAMTIQDEDAPIFQEHLNNRIKKRKKSRLIAYSIGAIAILGLIVISVIGTLTAERLYRETPKPSFEGVGGALENISRDLREQRDLRDQQTMPQQPVNNTPTESTQQQPVGVEQQPVPLDSNPLNEILGEQPTQSPTSQPQETVEQPETVVMPTTPQTQTNDTTAFRPVDQEPRAAQQTQTEQTQTTAPLTREQQVEDCILGYAVVAEAEAILTNSVVPQQNLAQGQTRLNAFTTALERGCTPLNISPLTIATGIAGLDQTQVQTIARNLMTQ